MKRTKFGETKVLPEKLRKWIDHVKKFSKEHKMTYPQALKDPRCKSSYKK
jgi:hypothetical protein